jgi:N-acetyl-gamma-glutamyl-phosphate reductase
LRAYRALTHQHQPEIQQVLTKLSQGRKIALSFVPHLAPFDRGILATSFFRTRKGVSEAEIRELFVARYAEEPFVHLADGPEDVRVHQVVGTNLCRIGWALDTASGRGVVVAALDNLLKGAAGQAVQNFNCLNGFLETEGLLGLRRTYS